MNMKSKIIGILKNSGTVSGEEIASNLGISRSDVNKHIKNLRKLGYGIDAKKNFGYSLKNLPDEITYENLELLLSDEINGISIRHFNMIGSTQVYAKKLAEKKSQNWLVISADEQTAGYGRLRRAWVSNRGGLWFSIILKPNVPPSIISSLPLVASLAVTEAVKKMTGLDLKVKWPNDIVCKYRGGFLKVAGIITEMSTDVESVHWVVIGVGVNVNNELPGSLKGIATNVKKLARKEIASVLLMKNILTGFAVMYDKFSKKGFSIFKDFYNERCILANKHVIVSMLGNIYEGMAKGVDENGELILYSDGKDIKVVAGDVSIKEIR